jgi:hypothetical protein
MWARAVPRFCKAFEFAKRRRFGMNEDGICCGLSIRVGTLEFFLFSVERFSPAFTAADKGFHGRFHELQACSGIEGSTASLKA